MLRYRSALSAFKYFASVRGLVSFSVTCILPCKLLCHLHPSALHWLIAHKSSIRDERRDVKRGWSLVLRFPPDWIIEIVSPSSRRMDYFTKLFKYQEAGIREYWIVDPDKDRILVYNFETEDTGDYTFSDTVKAGIYDDLEIDFRSIEI